jgi:hypothetical protein
VLDIISVFEENFSTMKPSKQTPLGQRMTHNTSGIAAQRLVRTPLLVTITFAILAMSSLCGAQDQEPNVSSLIEVARAGMQADRATIITAAMNFSDKEAAAFWPIYRQYEYERSKLDDGRVVVIKEYTQKYPALTDAEAKSMAERMFECDSRQIALKKAYFKKFNKVLPALTVTKFFQVEHRIDLLMDMNVEASLPPLTRAQNVEPAK